MFSISVLNIIPFLTCHVVSFSITLDESPLYNEDFQSLQNHTDYVETLTVDEHDLTVNTIRTFLIIGYVVLLFIVIYVCQKTYKNRPSKSLSDLYVNTNTVTLL